jgi:hypothetical protein
MQIILDCGVKVSVTSCHFTTTYGGLPEGVANRRINEMMVEQAEATRVFGEDRPTHWIPPVIDESGQYPSLPPYTLSAWLVGPFETESHLVVVWFRDDFDDLPFSQVIGEAIKTLPWRDLAGYFCF